MMTKIRIGTRGSPLALWQANYVADLLRRAAAECTIELTEIHTKGDVAQDAPLAQIGGEGAFTKEIQRALQDGEIDAAVHSLKDLPTFAVDNLVLAAVPKRGPAGDALVSHAHSEFDKLPQGARVATSSLRRQAQMLNRRPDLQLIDIRGNVDTRLRKLREQNLDALILAEAGLRRLDLADRIKEVLDSSWMLPAVGQGALGIECRADDKNAITVLQTIDHSATRSCVLAERAMLRGLGGGCHVPIGAVSNIENDLLSLRGVVLSPDGGERIEEQLNGAPPDAVALGESLAKILAQMGAKALLA